MRKNNEGTKCKMKTTDFTMFLLGFQDVYD